MGSETNFFLVQHIECYQFKAAALTLPSHFEGWTKAKQHFEARPLFQGRILWTDSPAHLLRGQWLNVHFAHEFDTLDEYQLPSMPSACRIKVRGVVQGVGFRPFVYRIARELQLCGWVLNGEEGVEIHLEGPESALQEFQRCLKSAAPPASRITTIEIQAADVFGFQAFVIKASQRNDRPTVRISPDLPVCEDCLKELRDPTNPRYEYPYINCTNCGPRYSVIVALPYDRPNTTMKAWPFDQYCDSEYHDPANRRFHAQPVACPKCGPKYYLRFGAETVFDCPQVIRRAVELLKAGKIVAVKGLGGYHLACDARNANAVSATRERKFRKEKPFAVMVKDAAASGELVELSEASEALLTSVARPIVLAPARLELAGVAPGNPELGVMLPYTPLQHMLFDAGAPDVLVMTSANRSSEPIAYDDQDALERLSGIADAFLIGERPIARRVEDSVARAGTFGPIILRRSRGYAPGVVTAFPVERVGARPILAVGADLKNTVTLVVQGQALVSQYIGDLDHYEAFRAFEETISDLMAMYEIAWRDVLVVHDAHPEYRSTTHALQLAASAKRAVQHHRAHVASVLAERGEWDKTVLGVSFDGTGYGDDGSIWGGEFFTGNLRLGFERVAHLRRAALPGGDAAAHYPVQAAAGFLAQVEGLPDLASPPFSFPARYQTALQLVHKDVRTFGTTSVGRLFDAAAALLGFTREITFEGQAAIWLEHLAQSVSGTEAYPFPYRDGELDFRRLLQAVATDRARGRNPENIARAFQLGIADGVSAAVKTLAATGQLDTVVFSGGVFQNEMLLEDLRSKLAETGLHLWTNQSVPPNDGGISLGQAALAGFEGST
jgi:hydrogenase maturation protein HypF